MSKPLISILISLLLILVLISPGFGQTRVGKLGIGVEGSIQTPLGAGSVNTSAGFGGGLNLYYSLLQGLGIRSKIIINQLVWTSSLNKSVTTDFVSINAYLSGDLFPNKNLNVFVLAGGGMTYYDPKDPDGTRHPSSSSFDMQYIGGLGVDFFPNEFWSITAMGEYVGTFSQYYNGPANSNDDTFFRGSLQIRYYFFDELFVTKLLETQRDRMKRR
jgi:hypothetical protein